MNDTISNYYRNKDGNYCVLLYDNVPGGAGRVLNLASKLKELMENTYELVDDCTCGLDTCCYSCIASYQNQFEQGKLSRGVVIDILNQLLTNVPRPADHRD